MSRRIFKDVEDALARTIRQIIFHENRTIDEVVLEEAFDPLTGEIVPVNIEPSFYDSSADAGHIQYPHFFIKLVKIREDLFTNRAETQYGNQIVCANEESDKPSSLPKAYEQVLPLGIGNISTIGNDFTVSTFKIRKVQAGHWIRIFEGNNKGTYTISSITVNDSGPHTITVSNDLITNLPSFSFDSTTRIVSFKDSVNLSTIKVGDVFEDIDANTFNITAIDLNEVTITIDGVSSPNTTIGGKLSRVGAVFQNNDPNPVRFVILDPTKPVTNSSGTQIVPGSKNINAPIPIDAFYTIRIDSKERATHIEILNRMLEEFNPLRGALPTVIRTEDSAEELFTAELPSGGSNNIPVNNSEFKVNDKIFIVTDFSPSRSESGGYEKPFEAIVVDKQGTDTLILNKTVPDIYTTTNGTKIVSNAQHQNLFLHFVDHRTRDVEGAQYWVHEFDFWVQFNVDRKGKAQEYSSNISGISTPIENIDGIVILSDP